MASVISDYLNKYLVLCSKMKLAPLLYYQKLLTSHIDQGTDLESLVLKGNHPDLRFHRLTDPMITAIFTPFQGLQIHLTSLDLSYNPIHDEGAMVIAQFIKDCKALYEIYLSYTSIEAAGTSALSDALMLNDTVHTFVYSGTRIDTAAHPLLHVLSIHTTLHTLDLSNCALPYPHLLLIAQLLPHTHLTHLLLNGNGTAASLAVRADVLRHLLAAFPVAPRLRVVGLARLRFDDLCLSHLHPHARAHDDTAHDAPTFAPPTATSVSCTVRWLDVSANPFRASPALLRTLHTTFRDLVVLDVSHTQLTRALHRGLLAYVFGSQPRSTVKALLVHHAGMSADTLARLVGYLTQTRLCHVSVWGNAWDARVARMWHAGRVGDRFGVADVDTVVVAGTGQGRGGGNDEEEGEEECQVAYNHGYVPLTPWNRGWLGEEEVTRVASAEEEDGERDGGGQG